MAVNVTIRQKGLFQKKIDLNSIISCTGLSYGICDENYRLTENEIGEQTLLYDKNYLSRGIDLSIDGNDIHLQLSLPTSIHEIECFYKVIENIKSYLKKTEIIRDDEIYDSNLINSYIDFDIDGSMHGIDMVSKQIENGESEYFQIFGIMQPLSLGKKEIVEMKDNLNNFGDWMHRIQSIDAYYAVPKVYNVRNQLTGIYAIGPDIVSIVPIKPYIIMNQIEGIERWLVMLSDGKLISYDTFINHIDKEYYDANHVIVNISEEKVEQLIKEFEEEL